MSTTAESNVVEVTIYWPYGGSTVWRAGQAIVDEHGVTPLDAATLGALTGLLCGSGVLAPLDDERCHFISFVPRNRLPDNLRAVLPDLDRAGHGETGETGNDGQRL